ncbi:MAG: iron-containing alcohol dehydrogenase [Clostridiales bacterium]|nr:iron-containing alcohol dehydrogenase [Clostridiales bacterium]
MSFNFYMPVQIISGRGAVRDNADKFALGKKALIVSGRNSAKACGALDDVIDVLASLGIEWALYDKIVENPPVSVCFEGGKLAFEEKADFVVAIGGGSPLDAAKAIAAYAANPELSAMDIYTAAIEKALPIIAIPTTAGTGSEVDPVAVMTIDGKNVKKSFKSACTFPRYAILDPKYTESLGAEYTISTALDAFCHCVESYLSPKSTDISRMFAVEGARRIYTALLEIENGSCDLEALKPLREQLLTGATSGGIAINTTGTGFNHPLGYNLTLYKGIPHGSACGVFMEEYFSYNSKTEEGKQLIENFCTALSASPNEVAANIVKWSNVKIGKAYNNALTIDEIEQYLENVKGTKNYTNSPYVILVDEMRDIYTKLFG